MLFHFYSFNILAQLSFSLSPTVLPVSLPLFSWVEIIYCEVDGEFDEGHLEEVTWRTCSDESSPVAKRKLIIKTEKRGIQWSTGWTHWDGSGTDTVLCHHRSKWHVRCQGRIKSGFFSAPWPTDGPVRMSQCFQLPILDTWHPVKPDVFHLVLCMCTEINGSFSQWPHPLWSMDFRLWTEETLNAQVWPNITCLFGLYKQIWFDRNV